MSTTTTPAETENPLLLVKHFMMNMVEDCFDVCQHQFKHFKDESSSTLVSEKEYFSKCISECHEAYQEALVKIQQLENNSQTEKHHH